jgi:hypothetical protein
LLIRIVRAKTEFVEYMEAFNDELESFKTRVKGRAEARIEKALKEAEEVRFTEHLDCWCTIHSATLRNLT